MQIPRVDIGRSRASVALARWFRRTKGAQKALIDALGCGRTTAFYYANGTRVPSYERAQVIQKLTRGTVVVGDWRRPAGKGR